MYAINLDEMVSERRSDQFDYMIICVVTAVANPAPSQRQQIWNAEPASNLLTFWMLVSIEHSVRTVSVDYY